MPVTRVGVAPLWYRGGMTNESAVRAEAPGESFHKTMTLVETTREFSDDSAAENRWTSAVMVDVSQPGNPLFS